MDVSSSASSSSVKVTFEDKHAKLFTKNGNRTLPRLPSFFQEVRTAEIENEDKIMENHHPKTDKSYLARLCHEVSFSEAFNGLYSAKFSPKGDIIVTAFGDGGIQIRHRSTGGLLSTMRLGLSEFYPIMCCRFSTTDDNTFYASSACGKILKCNIADNEFIRFAEEAGNEVNAISLSVGGEHLISAGKDAAVRLYDIHTAKIVQVFRRNPADMLDERVEKFHRMRIFAVKFHPDFKELVLSGGWDDTVKIWDVRVGGGSIRSIKGPHICGDALDMHETKIVTGSWTVEESLQLWDMTSGRLIENIIPQNRPTTLDGEFLYSVHYFDGDSSGNHVVAGGTGTGALEVINLREKMVVANFKVKKAILTADSNKSSIVFGGMESAIRLAEFF